MHKRFDVLSILGVLLLLAATTNVIMIYYVAPIWNVPGECLGCNFSSTLIDFDGIILASVAAYAFFFKSGHLNEPAAKNKTSNSGLKSDQAQQSREPRSQILLSSTVALLIASVIVALFSFLIGNRFIPSLVALDLVITGIIIMAIDIMKMLARACIN